MQNNRNINVLYLTWSEKINNRPIFRNQVLDTVKYIHYTDPRINIYILCGIPIYSLEYFRDKKSIIKLHQEMQQQINREGINLHIRYIKVRSSFFYTTFYTTYLIYLGQLNFLKNFIHNNGINIIHCRSYHATNLALKVKKKYDLPIKVIFDTRGLFPEEGVITKAYKENSRSYRAWKSTEKKLLSMADAVVNVSDTFTDYINSITSNKNIFTIYTNTNLDIFFKDQTIRERMRKHFNLQDDQRVLVYCGDIGRTGWHSVKLLAKIFKTFQQVFPFSKLLIITYSDYDSIIFDMNKCEVSSDDIYIVTGKNAQETCEYMQAGDYSIIPYNDEKGKIRDLVGNTMIGSKTGEYFGLGIPLIVNEAVGGAAKLVKLYGIGCTYKHGKEFSIAEPLRNLDPDYSNISKKCVEVANKYFDIKKHAKQYIDIYNNILS